MTIEAPLKPAPEGRCPLCGSAGAILYRNLRDRLYSAPGTYGFYRCRSCRLVWLHPAPSPGDWDELYADYFTHSLAEGAREVPLPRSRVRQAVLATHFGYSHHPLTPKLRRLGRILSLVSFIRDMAGRHVEWLPFVAGGKLLEVGCGNGEFLKRMEGLGWDAQGVEPDRRAAQIARERLGLKVVSGVLEETSFPDGAFDAVVMNHVIEHIAETRSSLERCFRLLKPGGRLVAVTPNFDGLGRRFFQDAWAHLDPPRHLRYTADII